MNRVRENSGVRIRFLLGPAGSGKTFQCLSEVRTALLESPEGPPLIFLAPKQATFQIERALLADDALRGYTRLKISSFERLAGFLLDVMNRPAPRLLNDEGRVMVLRALLARHHGELKLFRASARLPGFAQQLGIHLRELQRARVTPERLRNTAAELGDTPLAGKLFDIAKIFAEYLDWLAREGVEDADHLLDVATAELNAATARGDAMPRFAGLWLDGFAEMTEQELAFLRALVPRCVQSTLAFCCEPDALNSQQTFSPWSVVAQTTRRCLNALAEFRPEIIPLTRGARGRFAGNSELAHLEAHWASPSAFAASPKNIRVVRCSNTESEAVFAAREICRQVRDGARYRDFAVLVRDIENVQDVVRRVFARYEIPFFLDRRQPVAHHPLAELTRYSLRTVTRGWKHEDWFGVLKSGLAGSDEIEIDRLENEALAHGWEGDAWLAPLQVGGDHQVEQRLEELRCRTVTPVREMQAKFAARAYQLSGPELADALRELWREFEVEKQLADWTRENSDSQIHATVWEQMTEWLDTLALGFARERLSIRDWLPILEAGLAGLSVGVIPPTVDEVVIGSIDRSRSPDLRAVFLLGVNEGVFPAPPPMAPVLTERDRLELDGRISLGPALKQQLAHERFYGYISCTRATERLFVSYADADQFGRKRNPSVFISHLRRLFPALMEEQFDGSIKTNDAVHANELASLVLRARKTNHALASKLVELPSFRPLASLPLLDASVQRKLSKDVVQRFYSPTLLTSVSRLEEFASCAFRFFITVGLHAQERRRFEVDARHTGTFQHEVLKAFHETLKERKKRWREITPQEARELVREIATQKLPGFKGGVLLATDRDRVEAENLIIALEEFIETIVGWARQYRFDPFAVELAFGERGPLPAWTIELGEGKRLAFRGGIDRVDVFVDDERKHAAVVVIDYKSSARKVDMALLGGGVQMQLFAYLSALRKLPEFRNMLGVDLVTAAGAFYLNLRAGYKTAGSRDEAMENADEARRRAYQHRGRFVTEMLDCFDCDSATREAGDQFSYKRKKDGGIDGRYDDPIPAGALERVLDHVEQQLIAMGRAIFSGDISINPYRHGSKTPCEHCEFDSICRIDRTSHEFRALNNLEVKP